MRTRTWIELDACVRSIIGDEVVIIIVPWICLSSCLFLLLLPSHPSHFVSEGDQRAIRGGNIPFSSSSPSPSIFIKIFNPQRDKTKVNRRESNCSSSPSSFLSQLDQQIWSGYFFIRSVYLSGLENEMHGKTTGKGKEKFRIYLWKGTNGRILIIFPQFESR